MLKLISHPLINIKLTKMRDKNTQHSRFRRNLNEIASLMLYEVLRDYKPKKMVVTTPLEVEYEGETFDKEIVFVPILRAGIGMVEGLLELVSQAKVGHIGLYRDEETLKANEYYFKMPNVPKDSYVIVVDPMLATGGSAIDAIKKIQSQNFTNISLVCLVGAPEGVEKVLATFGEDFNIFLAALDKQLNKIGYITPGLGDAGDRIFGTK